MDCHNKKDDKGWGKVIVDVLLWIVVIACFIFSFVGLVNPIIPSVLVIWAGVLVYYFGMVSNELSWMTWTMMVLLTILLFLADHLANWHFVDQAGGSKWGMHAATIGLMAGSFVVPPFGVIIVPFILVFLTELLQKKSWPESIKVAVATLLAFLSGTLAKAVIQLIMIGVFVVDTIL